ncbi:hypothetical protein ZIOFF_007177 [Zingiber officinale]|uniref:Uncharacterized protein n=1 Tax=Zingiber officinale TaxID=94328 RepID=A0A8J5ID75_ZINOF|nr:hypothetical protein ZIOFF_007177 [Zingiber officinale]
MMQSYIEWRSHRYQKVSPDVLLLCNGRKLSLRACEEDDDIPDYIASEGKSLPLARPASGSADPSPTSQHRHSFPSESLLAQCDNRPSSAKAQNNHLRFEVNGLSPNVGGGGLLRWGQNKRSRGSRADDRSAGDEFSANSRNKIQRRPAAAAAAMPPPPCGLYTRGANHRSLRNKYAISYLTSFYPPSTMIRNNKDGSNDLTQSGKRSPRVLPENAQKPSAKPAQNGCAAAAEEAEAEATDIYANTESSKCPFEIEMASAGEKLNLDKFEWPRIYISLSRKEKEDDFLAMKGTKLPHRPKKRPKNIEKALQYCFPGMWLSDLTRARYEVREKKCAKKVLLFPLNFCYQ